MYNSGEFKYKMIMHEIRADNYKTACFWAALGMTAPCCNFIAQIIPQFINIPAPIYTIYKGTYVERLNPWETEVRDVYDYIYESADAENKASLLEFLSIMIAILLAIFIAWVFYLIFIHVVESIIINRIDFSEKYDEKQAQNRRRALIGFVVVLYFALWWVMFSFDSDDLYININNDVEQSEELSEMENTEDDEDEFDDIQYHDDTDTVEGTPMDRGYPSNDLQYYIDHPDEPMPKELKDQVLGFPNQ